MCPLEIAAHPRDARLRLISLRDARAGPCRTESSCPGLPAQRSLQPAATQGSYTSQRPPAEVVTKESETVSSTVLVMPMLR